MKRASVASIFAGLLLFAFLREGSSQNNLIQQIAPGVYYRVAERDKNIIANTGWVVFRDYVLVIDANFPWGAKAVLPDIRKTTSKPIRYVFNTHYHSDHAFGNSLFVDAGATIVCSEDCTAESRAKNPKYWADATGTGALSLKPYRLEHPQISFHDKLVFDDGDKRVELIKVGPGHTKGDSAAWLPKERILFTGDLVTNFNGNNMSDQDADPDHWLTAIDSMTLWNASQVVPGHGPPGPAGTLLKGQRDYLAHIIEATRSAISKGSTADQLVKDLDLSNHKPWGRDAVRNETAVRSVYVKLSK